MKMLMKLMKMAYGFCVQTDIDQEMKGKNGE